MSGTVLAEGGSLPRLNDLGWRVAASGDFTNDGKRDIIFQHKDGWVAIWRMSGTALVEARLLNPTRVDDPQWRIVGSADFNGDGRRDLLWQHMTAGWVAVWLMNGINLVEARLTNPARVNDTNWTIVGTGDINGDGASDIVWQHTQTGMIVTWFMSGTSTIGSGAFSAQTGDLGWRVRSVVDMSGDGRPDLLWQHSSSKLAVTILDGLTIIDSLWLTPSDVTAGWLIVGPK
jgi:hypothetical protein